MCRLFNTLNHRSILSLGKGFLQGKSLRKTVYTVTSPAPTVGGLVRVQLRLQLSPR